MEHKKNIVVGVTGGIAAYKTCELVRLLVKGEFSVTVIMTKNAQEFVSPLTFSTLSGNPAACAQFDGGAAERIKHIDLADDADLVVVAPATANIIGKVSSGIADDLLSTVIMATRAPVLFCPSMNVNMYENPIVQGNIQMLSHMGYHFVEPGEGFLACGWEGKGRLAEPGEIFSRIADFFEIKDLLHMKLLVTAGPTRERIDPVRFISNRATGKMGFAIAERARARGADVTLVTGPTTIPDHRGMTTIRVESAADMAREVKGVFHDVDVVIKAAAVADLTPKNPMDRKLKKKEIPNVIELDRTEDILAGLGAIKGKKILVGFAAETDDVIENAKKKLKQKNLDLIVANDITVPGSGFGTDTNIVYLFDRNGREESLPMMDKDAVADRILDRVRELWRESER